jgi:hypothetical protein
MTATTVDLRLAPTCTTRHEFYRQIARLERELSASLVSLDAARRPLAQPSPTAKPHLLSDAELESTRDALVARLGEIEDLLVRQSADHAQARALLKRMSDAPAEYRWVSVTTKETGDEGCRTWQSVPVMGPVGILGNWWRIRMSSGCP